MYSTGAGADGIGGLGDLLFNPLPAFLSLSGS